MVAPSNPVITSPGTMPAAAAGLPDWTPATNAPELTRAWAGPELPGPELPGPELPGPELPEPELPGPELPGPELPGPELPGPELPGPELPGPELPEPELPELPVSFDTSVTSTPMMPAGPTCTDPPA